jgi:hypothetical protein
MKVVSEAKTPAVKEPEKKPYHKEYKEYSQGGYYKERYYNRDGYGYQSYRGRGYRGRGRAGSRGRGRGYKQRYDEDRYFQQELGTYTKIIELTEKEPIKDIKEESAEDDFLFSDNNKSVSPKREKVELSSPKKIVILDQSNMFISNETPIIPGKKEIPEEKSKKVTSSTISIQNTGFDLINKQPDKQPHKITTTQTTFNKTTPIVPEGSHPYMMPYPMYYYPPQGYDPNIQQQGQYPPMYYFVHPYGMNPNELEDMRRKSNWPQYNPSVIYINIGSKSSQ